MTDIEKNIPDIHEIPDDFCRKLEYVFTDVDDTITSRGRMPASSLDWIWKLHSAGVKVVIVTGRPAGWCDYFARMWPAAGVIGENGAFYFSYNRDEKKMKRVLLQSESERAAGMTALDRIRARVLTEVPGCGISADQPFRMSDLAVDFCEDVSPLDKSSIKKICSIMEEEGATYKVSSIHVNCWFGNYDKLTCFNRFLEDSGESGIDKAMDRMIYIGDSPNDEPMFRALDYTAAVRNITEFLDTIEYLPAYISGYESGEGFADIASVIMNKRLSGTL